MDEPKPADGIPPMSPETNKDARTFAMLAHLLGALVGFLGPLIIWLVKREAYAFVDDQGKEALNFHLTLLIAYVGISVLTMITCGIGALLYPVVYVTQIIFGILGTVKANAGECYRYPVNIRMIK